MNHILPPDPVPPQRSTFGVIVLAGALVASLLLNATIGILYQDERAENQALQDRLANRARETPAQTVEAQIEEIAAVVEELRGLEFKRTVTPELLTSAQLQRRVRGLFDEENSRADFDTTQRVLETLGVVEPDLPLWDLFVAVHEEQVGGFYDEQARELVVLVEDAEQLTPFSRILLAHELTHALTDQHFGLGRGRRLSDQGDEDAAAAWLALVEGDASLVMSRYAQEVLDESELLAAGLEQGELSTETLDQLPTFLRRSLQFPYDQGLVFAQAVYEHGGNAALDEAYRDPPSSTEEILHPQIYVRGGEYPRTVQIDGVDDALGPAWDEIDDGDVGEYDVRLVGDVQARSGALTAQEASAAADGWAGGRYVALADGARTLVAMRIAFDSETEAIEAAELFGDWLPLRFGNVGAPFEVEGGRGWDGREGAGLVARAGDEIAIVLGPGEASVERARDGLSGF